MRPSKPSLYSITLAVNDVEARGVFVAHGPDESPLTRPRRPIDHIVDPFVRFIHIEAAGGIVLILAAVTALVLANSGIASEFLAIWKTQVGLSVGNFEFRHSLKHLINDGLMVIFFFVIGLEVKREIVLGELRDIQRAALPIIAALGGMVVPAGIYLMFQHDQPTAHGWGIPMATDIAFVVGCMAILGKRVPHALRVLLLTLAIADDIGAILVIAIGYSSNLSLEWLGAAIAGLIVVIALSKLGVRNLLTYILCGLFIWFAMHESGIHATLAGVVLGLITPARSLLDDTFLQRVVDNFRDKIDRDNDEFPIPTAPHMRVLQTTAREAVSPVEYLINVLHPWVSFLIMPLFALANAGVPFHASDVAAPVAVAVGLGLLLGKPIGIFLFSFVAITTRIARMPTGAGWMHLLGGGALCGIGFTMALFVADLALVGPALENAKVGILAGSVLSAVIGIAIIAMQPVRETASTDA